MPVKTKMILVNSIWEKIYFSAGLAYTFFICMLTLNWVRMHRRELENQYSLPASDQIVIGEETVKCMGCLVAFDIQSLERKTEATFAS